MRKSGRNVKKKKILNIKPFWQIVVVTGNKWPNHLLCFFLTSLTDICPWALFSWGKSGNPTGRFFQLTRGRSIFFFFPRPPAIISVSFFFFSRGVVKDGGIFCGTLGNRHYRVLADNGEAKGNEKRAECKRSNIHLERRIIWNSNSQESLIRNCSKVLWNILFFFF